MMREWDSFRFVRSRKFTARCAGQVRRRVTGHQTKQKSVAIARDGWTRTDVICKLCLCIWFCHCIAASHWCMALKKQHNTAHRIGGPRKKTGSLSRSRMIYYATDWFTAQSERWGHPTTRQQQEENPSTEPSAVCKWLKNVRICPVCSYVLPPIY